MVLYLCSKFPPVNILSEISILSRSCVSDRHCKNKMTPSVKEESKMNFELSTKRFRHDNFITRNYHKYTTVTMRSPKLETKQTFVYDFNLNLLLNKTHKIFCCDFNCITKSQQTCH